MVNTGSPLKKNNVHGNGNGGGYTVRLAWGGRNDIRAGEVGDGSEFSANNPLNKVIGKLN